MSIKDFLTEHEYRSDDYEMWGAVDRPEHPFELGELRAMARAHDFVLALLADHEATNGRGCAAHSEGQLCCLDDEDPYGAALRTALGLPHPATYKMWGANGWTSERPVIEWTPEEKS